MLHVTVFFNPDYVDQEQVDRLKRLLCITVAQALSDTTTLNTQNVASLGAQDILTKTGEVVVRQSANHPTDQNTPPVEIFIFAGRSKDRDPEKVRYLIALAISKSDILRMYQLGDGQSCVWIHFSEVNSFGFIPRRSTLA